MHPSIETRKGLHQLLLGGAVVCLTLAVAGTAFAAPVTFNLNYAWHSGEAATAVGTFTVDDSLLVPDIRIGSEDPNNLDDLLCFNLTVTGVPGEGTLTFTKADLDHWIFERQSGSFNDVNFFMECDSREFIIDGVEALALGLYRCGDGPVTYWDGDPSEGGVCTGETGVPALDRAGLLTLLLLVGIAAVVLLKRGFTAG